MRIAAVEAFARCASGAKSREQRQDVFRRRVIALGIRPDLSIVGEIRDITRLDLSGRPLRETLHPFGRLIVMRVPPEGR